MASNFNPVFPLTAESYAVLTTNTANTARGTTPTASSVVDGTAAGTNGSRIDRVKFTCTVANAVGLIQVWHKIGSLYYLIDEILTAAVTPSTTVAAATYTWTPPAGFKFLKSGELLAFTISKAEVWSVAVDQHGY